jgi:hypothetical protein
LTLFAFQIIFLKRSISAYSQREALPLNTTWCSPAFLVGTKVFDLECTYTPIEIRKHFGVGCINMPGALEEWLLGLAIVLSVELVTQLVDIFVLWRVPSSTTIRGIKIRRPWGTMILGVVAWVAITIIGLINVHNQPMLAGTNVGIVTINHGECASALYSGGLRGAILAWSDGILEGWGKVYHGLVTLHKVVRLK